MDGFIKLPYISSFLGKVRHVRYTKVLKYVSFKYDHIRCPLHGRNTQQFNHTERTLERTRGGQTEKVAVLLQKAPTFVPRVIIEPLNLIAKVINHLRIGFLVLVL